MVPTKIVQLLSVSGMTVIKEGASHAQDQIPVIALALLGDGSIRPVYLECRAGQTRGRLTVGPCDAVMDYGSGVDR
jgi:hypothetical protein